VTLLFILLIGLPLTTISVTAALEGKGREGKGSQECSRSGRSDGGD